MTNYEKAYLGVSAFAVAISTASLVVSWRTRSAQARLEKIQTELGEQQLRDNEQKAIANRRADLAATLERIGSGNFRLLVQNLGSGAAQTVDFTIQGSDRRDPFLKETPFASLIAAGHSETCLAALSMDMPLKYILHFTWDNDDGTKGSRVINVSV